MKAESCVFSFALSLNAIGASAGTRHLVGDPSFESSSLFLYHVVVEHRALLTNSDQLTASTIFWNKYGNLVTCLAIRVYDKATLGTFLSLGTTSM